MTKVLSTCTTFISPNEIKFLSTNIKVKTDIINFTIDNQLNYSTKLMYKGYKISPEGDLQLAFINVSSKIEDFKIRKGQQLGVLNG